MKKLVSYNPEGINNFHNCPPINLRVDTDKMDYTTGYGEALYVISASQNRRLEKHFCGMSSCECPKGGSLQLDADGTLFGIHKSWCYEAPENE